MLSVRLAHRRKANFWELWKRLGRSPIFLDKRTPPKPPADPVIYRRRSASIDHGDTEMIETILKLAQPFADVPLTACLQLTLLGSIRTLTCKLRWNKWRLAVMSPGEYALPLSVGSTIRKQSRIKAALSGVIGSYLLFKG